MLSAAARRVDRPLIRLTLAVRAIALEETDQPAIRQLLVTNRRSAVLAASPRQASEHCGVCRTCRPGPLLRCLLGSGSRCLPGCRLAPLLSSLCHSAPPRFENSVMSHRDRAGFNLVAKPPVNCDVTCACS